MLSKRVKKAKKGINKIKARIMITEPTEISISLYFFDSRIKRFKRCALNTTRVVIYRLIKFDIFKELTK